jgi:hypothetical protein
MRVPEQAPKPVFNALGLGCQISEAFLIKGSLEPDEDLGVEGAAVAFGFFFNACFRGCAA